MRILKWLSIAVLIQLPTMGVSDEGVIKSFSTSIDRGSEVTYGESMYFFGNSDIEPALYLSICEELDSKDVCYARATERFSDPENPSLVFSLLAKCLGKGGHFVPVERLSDTESGSDVLTQEVYNYGEHTVVFMIPKPGYEDVFGRAVLESVDGMALQEWLLQCRCY